MLDGDGPLHQMWLAMSAKGQPPPIRQVAEIQYEMASAWHIEEAFFSLVGKIDPNSPRKTRAFREMTRGGGKSTAVMVLRLYIAEYLAPFWKRNGLPIRPENRHLVLFGRDQTHIREEILGPLKALIVKHAPWLRTPDWKGIVEDADDPSEDGLRRIADMKSKGAQKWEAYRIDLSNGITIKSRTIRQSARGLHVFYFDFDDILTEENVAQSGEILDMIDKAVMPALEPGGLVLYDGTPQGPGDCNDVLLHRDDWDRMQHPAQDLGGKQVNGQPLDYIRKNREWLGPSSSLLDDDMLSCLWPARITPLTLEDARGRTRETEEKFLREYMLDRTPASASLVHHEDIAAAKDETLSYHFRAMPGISYAGGVDPSGRKKDEAAFCVGAVTKDGIRIPLHFTAMPVNPHLPAGEGALSVVTELNELVNRFACYRWTVEANGLQSIIIALQRRLNPSVVCEEFDLNSNKHTERGWKGIRTLFQSRMVRLPYRTKEDKAITDAFVDQLRGLQYVNGEVIEDSSRSNDRVSAFFLFVKATNGIHAPVEISSLALPKQEGPSFDTSPSRQLGQPPMPGDGELRRHRAGTSDFGSLSSIEGRLARWAARRR